MNTRPIDVLLYGAGGFTGRLTVAELARHAPPGLRWALAGRNRGKLEAARDAAAGPSRPAEILEADSSRPETVDGAGGDGGGLGLTCDTAAVLLAGLYGGELC